MEKSLHTPSITSPDSYYSFNHKSQTLDSAKASLREYTNKDNVEGMGNGELLCHKEVQTEAAEMA